MNNDLTLVLDLGSHACRVILFSPQGKVEWLNSIDISTHHPAPLNCEQDAMAMVYAFRQLLERIPAKLMQRTSQCGLCTQRSSVVAWLRDSGEPLSPAISWRDLRNQALIDAVQPYQELVRHVSGLMLSPHYSASKIHWLLGHDMRLTELGEQQRLCISPLASFILFHLLDQPDYVIDHTNAQRTQLFNIHTLDWSLPLMTLFDIDVDILPRCVPVIYPYGKLKHWHIPLTAVCGDQNAAFHAFDTQQGHSGVINIGTGAFVLSEIPAPDDSRLLCSIANSDGKRVQTLAEGTINGAGAALSWLQQQQPVTELFQQLPSWLNDISRPPVFINTIAGLGSPWWCQGGESEFLDDAPHSLEEKYVATIESIAFLINANLQQLRPGPDHYFVSGGLSRLDGLCQKLASLSQCEITRHESIEASALGCALLANQLTQADRFQPVMTLDQHFLPQTSASLNERYQQFVGELKQRCNN